MQVSSQQQINSASSISIYTSLTTQIRTNLIQLKNQVLQPQIVKISINDPIIIKVSHNNSYGLSQIGGIKKKFIFAIQELELQSDPLEEGQEYQFEGNAFNKQGEFRLICVNLPKIESKIIVEKSNSQSADQFYDSVLNINLTPDLLHKTPVKLAQVKQEQPEDQMIKQNKQQMVGLSNSKSDLQQYERILTEQDDPYSDTLQNKYIKYFKEQFKLWRTFFEQKQQKEKKQLLKSKHTKNLSLSQVKQIDPRHRSEYDSQQDSGSQNNSSSIGKNASIASHLYSHQQILDRNNDDDINSGRKQMKKTNSEYGFNIMRSEEEKEPTEDKISIFGKEQQEIHLLASNISLSRRSNHQSSSNKPRIDPTQKKKSHSRISMSRTQTNSPILREYSKKQNNFLTWAQEWAKQKQYKKIQIQKKQDHHLIKQMDAFMKNKFKVAQFLYC